MPTVESRRPLHQRDMRFVEMVRVMRDRLPSAKQRRDTPIAFRGSMPAQRGSRPGSRKS